MLYHLCRHNYHPKQLIFCIKSNLNKYSLQQPEFFTDLNDRIKNSVKQIEIFNLLLIEKDVSNL